MVVTGQKFSGSAVFGANFSQIDGDFLHGFRKIGITAGGRIGYLFNKNMTGNIEFLYSERGSAIKLFEKNPQNKYTLRYIEIPFVFSIHDWWQEDKKYFKARLDAGFSYANLFQLEVPDLVDSEEFKNHDVSYLIGFGLQFTKHIGLGVRYTRSVYDMLDYTLDDGKELKFRGYFVSTRLEYVF